MAERRLTARLASSRTIYALRLGHALAAAEAVSRRNADPGSAHGRGESDAVGAIQDLDRWHLRRVAETRGEFYAATRIGDRDTMAAQRGELYELLRRQRAAWS